MPDALQLDRRQHPRIRISWPVVVNVGKTRYLSYSLDISVSGAKVRTKARLVKGAAVKLELAPSDQPPLRVGAVVWRVDSDGIVFRFNRGIEHPLIRD